MTTNSSPAVTQEILNRMEEKILKNRPQLKKIKEVYGSLSYFSYVKQKNRINPNKRFRERKREIVDVIKNEVTRLLGTAVASEVEKQLKNNDSVSTAEHSSPIGTPHILSTGLHASVPLFDNTDPRFRNIIILSCSGVSFSNSLSFSRGFQFHLFKDKQTLDSQIAFFGRSVDPKTVLYSSPYTQESITEIQKHLSTLQREGTLSQPVAEKIQTILQSVYATPHAYTGADYVDQLTITNYYFWKKLFPSFIETNVPNYIMLSQEKILLNLLTSYHIAQDTAIHRFIFDRKYNELTEKYFDGITGAFKNDRSAGTFLFWGISKKDNYRMQLFREGDQLVSKDGQYKVALEPEAIRNAIQNKEIFPGLLLTFVVLSFYYGLLLGGGASQPTYLTQMKKAYIGMMHELGDTESVEDSEESVTDDFVFYRPHLAFLDAFGERISASGMDMYLYQDPANWKEILRATKSITMAEFITILLPILYKQFCPDDQKEEALMNISRQDVEAFTGFDKKLPPLGVIS